MDTIADLEKLETTLPGSDPVFPVRREKHVVTTNGLGARGV